MTCLELGIIDYLSNSLTCASHMQKEKNNNFSVDDPRTAFGRVLPVTLPWHTRGFVNHNL